ncbi:septin-7-like [Petromyzon marinus]|uniref:septin-7-like n=1 Tax=Petromyzon marinus TaxID=7757 RepID=UPI003F6F97FD
MGLCASVGFYESVGLHVSQWDCVRLWVSMKVWVSMFVNGTVCASLGLYESLCISLLVCDTEWSYANLIFQPTICHGFRRFVQEECAVPCCGSMSPHCACACVCACVHVPVRVCVSLSSPLLAVPGVTRPCRFLLRDFGDPAAAKAPENYVGFANLPNQVYRKSVKRGFEFTLMVVGESGLGKSTLINSLFLTEFYSSEHPGPSQRIKKTVQVEQSKALVKEGGVHLTLTVVDTPGFGDAVDNSNCWQPVIDFIDSKFEDFLNGESRVNRRQLPDRAYLTCVPNVRGVHGGNARGARLKPLDIEFMKRLHEKVNIIPLISKADTLTPDECKSFKKQIMKEIAENKIKIYDFPDTEDEEENKMAKKIKERIPLAVVGSNTLIDVNGKKVRGRQYPWGVAEVENGEHCDFNVLRNMLIRTHMQDLKDVTNNVHYENFRSRQLASVACNASDNNKGRGQLSKSPMEQMEEERRAHEHKMKKMELEMEHVFALKVEEKLQKLRDSEGDLQRRHEQMRKNMEAQGRELEDRRRHFEEEKAAWESQMHLLEQQQRAEGTRTLERNKRRTRFSRLPRTVSPGNVSRLDSPRRCPPHRRHHHHHHPPPPPLPSTSHHSVTRTSSLSLRA